jgi:Dual specificity phosphatase, catalytic domain
MTSRSDVVTKPFPAPYVVDGSADADGQQAAALSQRASRSSCRSRVVAPSEQWEVYPRLFIGRSPEPGEHIDVDILVRLAEPFAPGVSANGSVVDHPLDDAEDAEVVDKAFQVVRALVPELAAAWREGKSIRIGCLAGLNRSGLVVAALLTEIAGMTGHEAVAHLRWKRGSMALCNARFHEVLCESWAPSA